jgi:RNA polymerase sigma factor (sigma-70 family)
VIATMERLEGLTDAELLARTSTDVEAFAAFYRRHVSWVLRVAARRTGSREHASDLTAEVFSAALVGAGGFRSQRSDGQANNWLFGILLRKLADFERRGAVERRGRRRLGLREPAMTVEEFDGFAAGDDRAPSIAAALERLPAPQRDAVRVRVVEERSYEEVAAVLKISEANARKRVSRGLAMLRAELAREA